VRREAGAGVPLEFEVSFADLITDPNGDVVIVLADEMCP
jgi:hypothetical protein